MNDPLMLRLHLERATLQMVQAVDEALNKEEIKRAIESAIAKFDFEAEVERVVRTRIQEVVQRRIEWAVQDQVNATAARVVKRTVGDLQWEGLIGGDKR